MKFNDLVNNLSSGEWSPKMRAKTDVQQYKNAVEKLTNMIPLIQGGAARRPGSKAVIFSSGTYKTLLEAFNQEGAYRPVLVPVVTSFGINFILVIGGGALPSTSWFTISGTTPTTGLAISVDTGADLTLGGAPRFCQVGDAIIITDSLGSVQPLVWFYTGNGGTYYTWSRFATVFAHPTIMSGTQIPYLPVNALGSSVNLTASGGTGGTLTASSAYFNTPGTTNWIGTHFKLSAAGSTGIARVTNWVSTTVVDFITVSASNVPLVACGTAAGTSWEESAWDNHKGWPKYCVAHESRLVFGGHPLYPTTIWGSRIGNVFEMMERPLEQDTDFATYTADNSRPYTLIPATQGTGIIVGLSAGKNLIIHTADAEIVGAGSQGALGPLDPGFTSSTSFGSIDAPSARVGNFLLFVEAAGRRVRDMAFNFEEEQYKSADLTFMADHLTLLNATLATAAGSDLDPIADIISTKICGTLGILCRTTTGRLLWLSLDKEYALNGWAEIIIGGSLAGGAPEVRAMCSLAGRIYLFVVRTINSVELEQLEYLTVHAEGTYMSETIGRHMDSMATFTSGSPTVTVTGATHLAGQTVQVIADGQYVGEKTVSTGGVITLATAASNVIYGLRCDAIIKTFPPELGQQIPGTSQGLIKRISEITIRFLNTYGAKYGQDAASLFDIDFKDPTAPMDNSPVLYTGMKKMSFPGDYMTDKGVILESTVPFPMHVLAIISKGVTYD